MVVAAEIYADDDVNQLMFTQGYLPNLDTLIRALPKSPLHLRIHNRTDFTSRDAAAAYVLTRLGRRTIHSHRRYGGWGLNASDEMELETWVIGYPGNFRVDQDSVFHRWFALESVEDANIDYHLMIHRTPKKHHDQNVHPMWDYMYASSRRKLKIQRRTVVPPDLFANTKAFMHDILRAYEVSHDRVESLMQATGFPYWYSTGL